MIEDDEVGRTVGWPLPRELEDSGMELNPGRLLMIEADEVRPMAGWLLARELVEGSMGLEASLLMIEFVDGGSEIGLLGLTMEVEGVPVSVEILDFAGMS